MYKLKNQEALWYCEVGITLSGSKNIPGIFNHIKVIYLIITDCVMIFDFDMIVQVFSENEYSAFFVIDYIFVSGIGIYSNCSPASAKVIFVYIFNDITDIYICHGKVC